MKNEFQEILKQKLQAVDKPAQKPVSFVQTNPSHLSLELVTRLNPMNICVKPKKAYWNSSSEQQAMDKEKTYAQTNTKAPEEMPTEILGEFFNNESVRTAKIFFASVGHPINSPMSLESLKRVYRKLAKKLHPDMKDGKVEEFRLLKESYEILKKNWHSVEAEQFAA